jgi:hypothetical protein
MTWLPTRLKIFDLASFSKKRNFFVMESERKRLGASKGRVSVPDFVWWCYFFFRGREICDMT